MSIWTFLGLKPAVDPFQDYLLNQNEKKNAEIQYESVPENPHKKFSAIPSHWTKEHILMVSCGPSISYGHYADRLRKEGDEEIDQ